MPVLATLIGDVIGSKESEDRSRLHEALMDVLAAANGILKPFQPLHTTIGDEFQGGFTSVADAVRASLVLRVELHERAGVDSRYGLGYGDVTVFETRAPMTQDGPGWWAARAAVERARHMAKAHRTSFVRTCLDPWPPERPDRAMEAAALDAFLICRDATIDQMSQRARRLLVGLMLGRAQGDLADEEGITQSAVSQSLGRSGAAAIVAAQQRLAEAFR
jgi:hypothetical protein